MKKHISSLALLALSGCALADINVGLQLGYSHTQGSNTYQLTPESSLTKKGNITYGAYLGYEQFVVGDYFKLGAEASYYYSYNALNTDTGQAGNLSLLPVMVVGKVVFPYNFNAFVKAGYAYINFDGMDVNSSSLRPSAAGGVGYSIDNIDIFAQALYISFSNVESNYGVYTLGIGYSF